jgi:hypothetical protein
MPGEAMTDRGLARWQRKLDSNDVRSVVCLGDSITFVPSMAEIGVMLPWVDQLTAALERSVGPRVGDGFRGLWHDNEWTQCGAWTQTQPTDPFDVAPFRRGLYSSGCATDELVWAKPETLTVHAFDVYSFHVPDAGTWQYRVDGGPWTSIPHVDDRVCRYFIHQAIEQQLTIRGHDQVAPVMGIGTYTRSAPGARGVVVHNLGHQQQFLTQFCRPSAGDPLALLDVLAPDLVTVLFSNDVVLGDAGRFAEALETLVTRVGPYADVLIMTPFEQRTPRCVDDAVTVAGSAELTSQYALFLPTDEGKPIEGANIAAETSIARVQSTERATMTVPATGTSSHGEMRIESRRSGSLQARYRAVTRATAEALGCRLLDLADAWTASVGPGWDAAYAAGFMYDGLHPSQTGHNDIAKRVAQALGI